MDLRAATISCIERMPETEETDRALKHIYAIAKKAGKESRCAPKRRDHDTYPRDMMDEIVNIAIRKRAVR